MSIPPPPFDPDAKPPFNIPCRAVGAAVAMGVGIALVIRLVAGYSSVAAIPLLVWVGVILAIVGAVSWIGSGPRLY